PAMNVEPAPMITIALMAESSQAALTAARIPSGTPGLSAFTGGLSIVITATSFARVILINSLMCSSLHRGREQPSTIDYQRLPCHERRAVAREQERCLGDFSRLAQVPDRLAIDAFLAPRLILPIIFAQ